MTEDGNDSLDGRIDTHLASLSSPYTLRLSPAIPDFGVLCQGLVYGMTITVFNSGLKPERLRVFCNPIETHGNIMGCTYEPMRLAPGMSTDIQLKIECNNIAKSSCLLRVVQASTQVECSWTIRATVTNVEMYQSVSKSLKLQGRPLTNEKVKALGQISHINKSALASAQQEEEVEGEGLGKQGGEAENVFSKAFMDREELNEVATMPLVDCMYYDPWDKKLKVCDTMLSVEVDTKWTIDDSKKATNTKLRRRIVELEDKGMFTRRSSRHLATQLPNPEGSSADASAPFNIDMSKSHLWSSNSSPSASPSAKQQASLF